ncbi:MAG: hypothetical protein HKN47_00585 [Pirellulaceae bacterium]|nr:hypothetical protein [Pirellulaceae bacterium]
MRFQLIAVACFFLSSSTVAIPTAQAKDDAPNRANQSMPDGSPARISDWALAGVVWSDASLVKKLANDAIDARGNETEQKPMQEIADKTQRVIRELEKFGWKQSRNRRQASSATSNSSTRPMGLKRLDTETPAGRDDPGLDDERTQRDVDIDIDQYRVDDVVDETPAEARNLADAREDGVEKAIAAASTRGIAGPVAGHISRREVTTRSATLPYAEDSIYDADDYDPDVDYDANTRYGSNEAVSDRGDRDDDIDRDDPAEVVSGEDELYAATARARDRSRRGGSTNVDRFTTQAKQYGHDANWVQFHLDANQIRYNEVAESQNRVLEAQRALRQLKNTVMTAGRATDNQALKGILQPILDLKIQ